jgi:hypothetical protein
MTQFDLDHAYDYERTVFVADLNGAIMSLNELQLQESEQTEDTLLNVLQILNRLQTNRAWVSSVRKLDPSNNTKALIQEDLTSIGTTWTLIRHRLCEIGRIIDAGAGPQFAELKRVIVGLIDQLSADI